MKFLLASFLATFMGFHNPVSMPQTETKDNNCTAIVSGSAGTVTCTASTCKAAKECAIAGYKELLY